MHIGELASNAGVSTRMVRHYANQGLLDVCREANGYRVFDPGDVDRVRQIHALIGLGLSVHEIHLLRGCLDGTTTIPGCAPAVAALRRQLAELEDRIDQLGERRDVLRDAVRGI